MATTNALSLYDKFIDYLSQKATPEEILAFQLSEEEQQYARELVERNNAGTLTAEEKLQVQALLQFERTASKLKAKALSTLKHS